MMHLKPLAALALLVALARPAAAADAPVAVQTSESGITHSLLITGRETYVLKADGTVGWTYPNETRDGFVLPSGNVLLAVSKGKAFPKGGAVELTREGKEVFRFEGTQSEVDCVQALGDGKYLVTESGPKPRLMEVDAAGKVLLEFPLVCQTKDFHHQTRMARKLASGNYLVPHLLDKVVKEYTPAGKVVWEAATPNWPFTAIRLDNGNTLVNCTRGNEVVEYDKDAKPVWHLKNEDLPTPYIKDACGGQRLPNGNTVIACYGAGGVDAVKAIEVTPDKKVVWTLKTNRAATVHELQVLDTNGKPVEGRPLK